MTDLEQALAVMLDRLRNGTKCWCKAGINPAVTEHTPTCGDATALMGRVGYEKISDARYGRSNG